MIIFLSGMISFNDISRFINHHNLIMASDRLISEAIRQIQDFLKAIAQRRYPRLFDLLLLGPCISIARRGRETWQCLPAHALLKEARVVFLPVERQDWSCYKSIKKRPTEILNSAYNHYVVWGRNGRGDSRVARTQWSSSTASSCAFFDQLKIRHILIKTDNCHGGWIYCSSTALSLGMLLPNYEKPKISS